MEEPRWEDLPKDCLVNIFGRVGMESLLLDVPFVCKSWYKATLEPLCWRHLDFHNISLNEFDQSIGDVPFRLMEECKLVDESSIYSFTKFVIKRSQKKALLLKLPSVCDTEDILSFAANECPGLRVLILPQKLGLRGRSWDLPPNFISKLKKLEVIVVPRQLKLKDIVTQISMHCNNFIGLRVEKANIEKDEALAIATLLPNLEYLALRNADIDKDNLVIILQGCEELVLFDGTECRGFKMGSLIPRFTVTGSKENLFKDLFGLGFINDIKACFMEGGLQDIWALVDEIEDDPEALDSF